MSDPSSYPVLRATVTLLLGALLAGTSVNAQVPKPKSLEEFVTYMQAHHRAPFDREGAVLPPGGQRLLMQQVAKLGNPSMATLAAAATTSSKYLAWLRTLANPLAEGWVTTDHGNP